MKFLNHVIFYPSSKKRPGTVLSSIVMFTGLMMFIPILYIIVRSMDADLERWKTLFDTRIPQLLWNTLSLTFVVTFCSILIGVFLSVLVCRTDLPGHKWWNWLLSLPLIIPPYVGAMTYIIMFGPRGWFEDWFGTSLSIFSFWGTAFVLTGFTYPYVYLIVSASLKKMNRNLEEVGRISGYTSVGVLWKVTLPLLRPAIGAGAILVALYVLSDFGAVAMLRFTTFTAAIYFQMGSFDRSGAAILSLILIMITVIFLWLQYQSKRKMKFYTSEGSIQKPERISLGKGKGFALLFVLLIFFLFTILPFVVLIYWSYIGFSDGTIDARFWGYVYNSFSVSAMTALIAVMLAFPLVYVKSRYQSFSSRIVELVSYAGYSLPGVIVALGVVFTFLHFVPALYGTIVVLITAYILRFLPKAMQAADSSLSQISPRIDEAALSLGKSPFTTMTNVVLVLMKPGIFAGAALVFVSVIKELPATLLLRPAGYDTLAVRIWIEASEGFYQMAAPSALLIIAVSIIPLRWMLKQE